MKLAIIFLLSALTGFLSLSQEIIWIRILMYATGGIPQVFAYVLGFFLIGIAVGSWWSKRQIEDGININLISKLFFTSSIIFYISTAIISYFYSFFSGITICLLIILPTTFSGAIFPIITHFSAKSENTGQYTSWIYFFNIIGSVLGSGITGFYLLEYYSLTDIVLFLLISGLIVSASIKLFNFESKNYNYSLAISILALIIFYFNDNIFENYFEKIHFKHNYSEEVNYKHLNENRSGIISTLFDHDINCDIIYGGGVYDSCFNIKPDGPNAIDRIYAIVKLHKAPKKILIIGLSSGSWVRALSYSKNIEKIDVIEINHGYLDLIKQYSEHSKIFKDPRISIYIDDGRRWLTRSKEKYDFILMNTTFHWRSYISNLVSSEFLSIIKNHLKNDGVVYYNTTGSQDIIYTAANNFKHVTTYSNFVAASDSPIKIDSIFAENFASSFKNNGEDVLNGTIAIKRILNHPFNDVREKFISRKDLYEITDDNMAVEYKKPLKNIYNPELSWFKMLNRIF